LKCQIEALIEYSNLRIGIINIKLSGEPRNVPCLALLHLLTSTLLFWCTNCRLNLTDIFLAMRIRSTDHFRMDENLNHQVRISL